MPVTPSFSGFASTPPTGQLFLEGGNQAIREHEFGQELQLKKQQLAQQYQIAEMETATRRQALQQQAMMQSHELEVQKAYQQAKLGLEAREIATKEQLAQDEIARAAATSESRMAMQRYVESLMAGGNTPLDAMTRGIAKHGPTADLSSGFYSSLINESQQRANAKATIPGNLGDVERAKGGLPGNMVRTSQNALQYVPDPIDRTPRTLKEDPDYLWIGNQRVAKKNTVEYQQLEKKRDKLEDKLDGAEFSEERTLEKKALDPKELENFSTSQKAKLDNYNKKRQEVADMEKEIKRLRKANLDEAARSSATAPSMLPEEGGGASMPKSGQVGDYSWTTE